MAKVFNRDVEIAGGSLTVGGVKVISSTGAVTADIQATAGSIGNTEIADSAITNAKVSGSAAIAFSKLATLTSGNILVGSAANVPASVAMSGVVAMDNTGATTIASENLTPGMMGTAFSAVSGITKGVKKSYAIAGSYLKAKLDTNVNNVFSVAANEMITDVYFIVGTPCGEACTVDIGADVNLDGVADVNGFIAAANANSAAVTRMTTLDVASQAAYVNGLIPNAAGAVTIQSSADESASAFDGILIVEYIVYEPTA